MTSIFLIPASPPLEASQRLPISHDVYHNRDSFIYELVCNENANWNVFFVSLGAVGT